MLSQAINPLGVTQTYGYTDGLNRLTSATETIGNTTNWTQAYSYDDYGNRAVTSSYTPNPYATPTALSQYVNNRWMVPVQHMTTLATRQHYRCARSTTTEKTG